MRRRPSKAVVPGPNNWAWRSANAGTANSGWSGQKRTSSPYDLDVANRCEGSPDKHCPSSHSTIGQHDGAGMWPVTIEPTIDRLEQLAVRVIVGI